MGWIDDFISNQSEREKRERKLATSPQSSSAIGGNAGQRQAYSGGLGDIFDLIQRPKSTVAGGVYNLFDKDSSTSFTEGMLEGITGRQHRNWSDILGEWGVQNRVLRSVGGFAGDVAFDPLTYVGLKGEKGLNAVESTAQAVRGVAEESPGLRGPAFNDAVERAVSTIEGDNPSHLYATFRGNKMGPDVVTPSKVANLVKDRLFGPAGDRNKIARAFDPRSELPFGLYEQSRLYDSGNAAIYGNHQKGIDEIFAGLAPEQKRRLTFAQQSGEDLSHVPADYGGGNVPAGFENLGAHQRLGKALMQSWFEDEMKLGFYKPEQFQDNYMPTYWVGKNRPPEVFPGLPSTARRNISDSQLAEMQAKINQVPLEEYWTMQKKNGMPLIEYDSILKQRAASSYRKVGRGRLVDYPIRQFGVLDTEVDPKWLQDNNWLDVKHISSPTAQKVAEDLSAQGKKAYLPESIIRTLNNTEPVLTNNTIGSEFLRWADRINRPWKFLNTVVNPGYWTRNATTDGIMNFMDGVRDPRWYQKSMKILMEQRGGNAFHMMDELVDKGLSGGWMDEATGASLRPQGPRPTYSKIKLNGQDISTDVIWDRFLKDGGKTGDIVSNISDTIAPEEKAGIGNYISRNVQKSGGFFNTAQTKLTDASQMREDFFRLAHYLQATEEGLKGGLDLQGAGINAGRRVRKVNIDYGGLTKFEKDVVRRVIPFYSWFRKNLPMQTELLLTRPGIMSLYPKSTDLMQGILGTDDGSGDYIVNKWIRDMAPVRVALGNNKSSNPIDKIIRFAAGAGPKDPVFIPSASNLLPMGELATVANPVSTFFEHGGLKNPVGATAAGTSELFNDMLSRTGPLIKDPIEIAQRKSSFTGQPIQSTGDWRDWLLGHITATRVANQALTSDSGARAVTSSLVGIPLQPVTRKRQRAELQRQKDILSELGLSDNPKFKRYVSSSSKKLKKRRGE
jgi:hypothetical protein